MNIDVTVIYPGDCLALLNVDVDGDGKDWELGSATLKKLAPFRHPAKRVFGEWVTDWISLPALDIALCPSEVADDFEVEICDALDALKNDRDDEGDWRYEQMKDRRANA